ncbi:MAG: hypothetical protein J0H56_08875 [Micrococcales bacterium]|nr:hypothetical protein [Micrococcales bacterium]
MEHAGAIFFLLVIIGLPLLIFIGALIAGNALAKPVFKEQRSKDMERELRWAFEDANEQQRIARKLLKEYGE